MGVRVKRVYAAREDGDGTRVLVDRLWPRGLSREKAEADLWLKDLAPSHELRRWFGHDPKRWREFRRRYTAELRSRREEVQDLRRRARRGTVTLLYSARDEEHNQAVALAEHLAAPDRGAGSRRARLAT